MSPNMLFSLGFLFTVIAASASLTIENHHQYMQEIIVQHEFEMKHAERINVKHDLPVVSNTKVSSFGAMNF